jgi:high affinity sulfate transporter 1
MGMFVYFFFGTSRELSVAPVAVNALLITSTLSPFADPVTQPTLYLEYVLVTTFLIGIFSLGFGLLNLGYAVTFVSPAVIVGFTSGSALVILVSQLETLFGFSTPKSDYALVTLYQFFANITKTKWAALLIGLVSLAIMEIPKRINKPKWVKLLPRPLMVVIIATVMAYLFTRFAPQFPVPIVGTVPSGLPPISIPQLSNSTMMINAVVPAFLLTIIGFLQSIAVTLRFSEKRGYTVRPSQELNALGLAHIVCSFFSSFDVTGGFSRTAVSAGVGTVSQFSSLVSTLGVLISILALTPIFYYLPKSALAAIIISAVIPLIDPEAYVRYWKVGQRIDFWVALGTAIVTFGVTAQIGIGVGVGVSLIGILYSISRPHSTLLGKVVVPTIEEAEIGDEEADDSEVAKDIVLETGVRAEVAEVVHHLPEDVADVAEAPVARPSAKVSFPTSTQTPQQPSEEPHIWRNVTRYKTQQYPGIAIFRFDSQLWFANAVYFRERCMKIVQQPDDFGYRVQERQVAMVPSEPAVDVEQDPSSSGENGTTADVELQPTPLDKPAPTPPTPAFRPFSPIRYLIIDFTPINSIDDAGFSSLVTLKSNLKDTCDCNLLLVGVKGPVRDVIWRSTGGFTMKESLEKRQFFRDLDQAVEFAIGEMGSVEEN